MDSLQQSVQTPDEHVAFPKELSPAAQKRLEAINRLLEPCSSRKEYGERLQSEAERLGVSRRTLHRYKRAWQEKGLVGFPDETRAEKGTSLLD